MNSGEVATVLARVQLGDNRKIEPDDMALVLTDWEQTIGDLGFDEAIAGVVLHRRTSTEWLTPAHLRENVRLIRNKQARAERIQAAKQRGELAAPKITLDRAQFELDTAAAIEAHRAMKVKS